MAERSVKTVKSPLEKSSDLHMAVFSYRAILMLWCNLSPAELLMGRCLKTDILELKKAFTPEWPHLRGFQEMGKKWEEKQKSD